MAHVIANGTRQTPQPCGFPCRQGTRETPRGAAANQRADWLSGARRATPFIWPSVSAPRIRSRLRPAASRAPGAQRSLEGCAGAASAARWRRAPCTSRYSRSAALAAVRRHGWRTVGGKIGARAVQARCVLRRLREHRLIARPTSTMDARCQVRRTWRWDRSSGCRTMPDSCC